METYQNIGEFLRNHKAGKDDNITHTRIGNGKDIYGGKYSIPDDKLNIFYKLYHNHVFVKNNFEYLTEVQFKNDNRPLLIDLDFRYETSIKERQHNKTHIEDIVTCYIDNLNKIIELNEQLVRVYVLEKDNVNCTEKVTKDGIHIVISVACDTIIQQMLREKVKEDLSNCIADLGIINDIDSILDDGITKGGTNWQLYGSRKPENQPYKLTYIYDIGFDDNFDLVINTIDIPDDNLKILPLITARNSSNPKFQLQDCIKDEYEKMKNSDSIRKKHKGQRITKRVTSEGFNFDVNEITTMEILEKLTEKIIDEVTLEEYHIKETHAFLMSLPEKYYNEYEHWIKCGWGLHNTSFKLFISWMYFSSQSPKFNLNDIPFYYDMWLNMNDEGITNRSIMYWSREEDLKKYKEIRENTVDYYMNITEANATEWDIANVLYQLFKDEYRCASLKKNVWFQFKKHKWCEIDSGTTLRFNISKVLSRLYAEKADVWMRISSENGDQKEAQEEFRKKSQRFSDIASSLKRTTFKQNIMKEAAEIFFQADPNFVDNLDTKRHLLCFTNGVWDFDKKEFRDGRPEDYLTLSTGIKYINFDDNDINHSRIKNEIDDFMEKLFPVPELRRYMWEHLASTLIGKNKSQTFNIYNGSGSNGKSKLVDLMTLVMGDYKGVVPITLVTQKRNGIGSASPEIAALKGVRYAVMQEPSKGDRLNDGIMKELTGEDQVQGRGLYQDCVTFIPQFKLVVCTNTLFDIKSNDDGTWRRIRLCEFMSKFVKEPNPTTDSPYEYGLDQDIGLKFESWKYLFMDMLVKLALTHNGIVNDCDLVLRASNEYRKGQDYLKEFFDDKIEKVDDKTCRIRKTEIYSEFKTWYQETYGKNVPKGKELYNFLDKKLGRSGTGGWKGYRIKYDMEEEEEDANLVEMVDNIEKPTS